MNPHLGKWLRLSLFNLLLVAILGVIMRYKIIYPLPWVDQKNLLHAHSHFAFAGWITQALMSLLVSYLFQKGDGGVLTRYRPVLYANLITAYGMLVTFPFMGYKFPSIAFSTLSIFTSYWFAVKYWRDLNKLKLKSTSILWFKAAVVFNAVSSLGAFSLAYMLAAKHIHPDQYLASIYFFLHFQYNGWFFFSCMGLLSYQFNKMGVRENKLRKIFLLFVTACVPAYFLSALWLPIGQVIYILVVISVFLQLAGWILMLQTVRKTMAIIKKHVPVFSRWLFGLSAIALTIKLLLQSGSVIPSLSQFAFGFRPIIIGYLHLVLLGVISLFIIAYVIAFKIIFLNTKTKAGVIVFVIGIIINEILLMIQGIADMSYIPLPLVNQLLLVAAFVLLAGVLLINSGQQFLKYDSTHNEEKNN